MIFKFFKERKKKKLEAYKSKVIEELEKDIAANEPDSIIHFQLEMKKGIIKSASSIEDVEWLLQRKPL